MKGLRILGSVEQGLKIASAAILFCIMLVVVLDVGLRYLFHAPLLWAYELISLFLLVGLFFFSLSWSYRDGQHVNVDLIYRNLPVRLRNLARALVSLLAGGAFAVVCWSAAGTSLENWERNEVIPGPVPWPTWVPPAMAVIGLAVLLVRLLREVVVVARHPDREHFDPPAAEGEGDRSGPSS